MFNVIHININSHKNMNMNTFICCRHMMDMEKITYVDNLLPTALVAVKQREVLVMSIMKRRKQ